MPRQLFYSLVESNAIPDGIQSVLSMLIVACAATDAWKNGENSCMSDTFPLFDEVAPLAIEVDKIETITDSQRTALRGLFEQLNVASARGQFDLVEEITGQRISRVQDLYSRNAMLLIFQLPERIKSMTRPNSGNAWADREEDTWIDKL